MTKQGRPKKNYVELHARVQPFVKSRLDALAKGHNMSQGEMIGILINSYDVSIQGIGEKLDRIDFILNWEEENECLNQLNQK